MLKKQLGEVQLEAVRCQELELGAAALQQEVASLREELARSEERGREERKEHGPEPQPLALTRSRSRARTLSLTLALTLY